MTERQQLIDVVGNLPDEALSELANFLDYLRYKTLKQKEVTNSQSSFLISVTGIGESGQQDISERDEDILRAEIDSVRGWNSNSSNRA